ncbi:MAG: flagellar motor switch protein FliN [Bacillota bacterium]
MKQGLSQDEIAALFATAGEREQEQEQPQPEPQPAVFPSLDPADAAQTDPASLGALADVELELTVELGQARRNIRDILGMGPGSVMELDKHAGETVDILVNGRLVARGEVVVIGENYGVRITELVNTSAEGSQGR